MKEMKSSVKIGIRITGTLTIQRLSLCANDYLNNRFETGTPTIQRLPLSDID